MSIFFKVGQWGDFSRYITISDLEGPERPPPPAFLGLRDSIARFLFKTAIQKPDKVLNIKHPADFIQLIFTSKPNAQNHKS